jgi:hemerythrin
VTNAIQWNDAWLIGVPHIDAEHRKLVALLSDLQHVAIAGKPRVTTLDALVALSAYIELHFGDEEHLMQQISYPSFTTHQKVHQRFVDRVQKFAHEFRLGRTEFTDEISEFLAQWIIEHIATYDVAIANFIKTEGIELTASITLPAKILV